MADGSIVIGGGVETPAEAPVVTPAVAPVAAGMPPVAVTAPVKEARPAWLPDKFKDAAQMAEAYKELEQRQSGKPVEAAAAVTTPVAPVVPPVVAPVQGENVADLLKTNGLDYQEFVNDFAVKGELSQASYDKLAAKGFTKSLVDTHMAGQKAVADAHATTVQSYAGGAEQYNAMVAWAATTMTDADKTAYNAAINSGNTASAKLAVEGLNARYAATNGNEPTLISGATGLTTSGAGFRSQAEVTSAMKDPRYQKDAAYRKDVADRLAGSTF